MEDDLRKNIRADFENQVELLQSSQRESEEKLKMARQRELDYLRKEQELLSKEQELQITIQKQLIEERKTFSEQVRKEELEKAAFRETDLQLKMKELE